MKKGCEGAGAVTRGAEDSRRATRRGQAAGHRRWGAAVPMAPSRSPPTTRGPAQTPLPLQPSHLCTVTKLILLQSNLSCEGENIFEMMYNLQRPCII